MSAEWVLVIDWLGRPTLTNAVHNMHHHQASADRKRWRQAGTWAARQERVPALPAITIDCWGRYPSGRLPDADAVAPSLKGVLDGLVDAGVIPDDDGWHVPAITYRAPEVVKGCKPALVVEVRAALHRVDGQ